MQILLANAKIMRNLSSLPVKGRELSIPLFQLVANELAAEMSQMDVEELARQLGVIAVFLPKMKKVVI